MSPTEKADNVIKCGNIFVVNKGAMNNKLIEIKRKKEKLIMQLEATRRA